MTEEEKKEPTTKKTTTAKKTTTRKAPKAPANETVEVVVEETVVEEPVAEKTVNPVKMVNEVTENVSAKVKETTGKIKDTANERIEDVTENPTVKQFIEHQKRGFNEAGQALESLLPEGFKQHGKNAVEAFVESYKALYNGVVENLNVNVEVVRKKQNEAIDKVEEALEEAKV